MSQPFSILLTLQPSLLLQLENLESGGKLWGEAGEGETQGDPASTALFCIALHPSVRELDRTCQAAGGLAIFGADDGFAVGPAEVVIPAVNQFSQDVKDRCLLQLEWNKSELFTWHGDLPEVDNIPEGITLAGKW